MRPAYAMLTLTLATLPGWRAHADAAGERRVAVRVVEVAGGRAFLSPGEDAGLERGTRVLLRDRSFTVVEVSAGSAVFVTGDAPVEEGDAGTALVTTPPAGADERVPAPPPLSHFAGKWPAPARPADRQVARRVSLEPVSAPRPLRLVLSAHLVGTVASAPASSPGELGLTAELSAEPWRERPFGLDADATAYAWWGPDDGPAGSSQVPVRVRELRLRYGGEANPFAAIGRLRWAARGVGLLDGVRVRVPVTGGLSLAGFGGFVPDALSGAPASDASRFGVATSWDAPDRATRPHLDATVSGSIFDGTLDERRIDVGGALAPGPINLEARGEVSLFAAGNPWGAAPVELTAAGIDVDVHDERAHAGLHLDVRQPERSRYLASLLPPGWLCQATPQPPGTPEACDGHRRLRLSSALDAGYQLGPLGLAAGASAIAPEGDGHATLGGYADLRVAGPSDGWRVAMGATALTGGLADLDALRIELGWRELGGRLDTSVYYRVSAISYVAALETFVQQRGGLDASWTVSPQVDLALTLEVEHGRDLQAATALATAVWRPFP